LKGARRQNRRAPTNFAGHAIVVAHPNTFERPRATANIFWDGLFGEQMIQTAFGGLSKNIHTPICISRPELSEGTHGSAKYLPRATNN
jgi:hypothetical protein